MAQRKYLTRKEIDALIAATKTSAYPERDRCMIEICFRHGLRVSELVNLQITDISLSDKTIYIQRLKNGFSTIQPLIHTEIVALERWLACRRHWRDASSARLFLSRNGGSLTRQYVYKLLKNWGMEAGITVAVHPHMLRHSCGYALADLGADTRLIQDYLGHRNIRHTVIYTASNAERFKGVWRER
ncbi:tyrosine-type DNA invertase [Enterobacter sp. ECC-175]|uniref:tyrosine-type DNA invertase n=1 Tax=Enterobacter sp. ECC-175 TaxID=3116479 RepID=UPI0037551BCD